MLSFFRRVAKSKVGTGIMKRELKIKRNESAIQGFRARMLSSGN